MGKIIRSDNFFEKDVINTCDGRRLGFVTEIEFDVCDGRICAIVVEGHGEGLFAKCDKYTVPWCKIKQIGEDVILVDGEECCPPPCPKGDKKKFGI